MSEYSPNRWVILEITSSSGKPFYKVMGSWMGGYLEGESWRMNSGIERVKEEEDGYKVYGFSGSVYYCPKESYGLGLYSHGVLQDFITRGAGRIRMLEEDEALKIFNNMEIKNEQ